MTEERRELIRLAKDCERLRLAFEILETLESMIFYRGGDKAPRMRILALLQQMSAQARTGIDELGDTNEE